MSLHSGFLINQRKGRGQKWNCKRGLSNNTRVPSHQSIRESSVFLCFDLKVSRACSSAAGSVQLCIWIKIISWNLNLFCGEFLISNLWIISFRCNNLHKNWELLMFSIRLVFSRYNTPQANLLKNFGLWHME